MWLLFLIQNFSISYCEECESWLSQQTWVFSDCWQAFELTVLDKCWLFSGKTAVEHKVCEPVGDFILRSLGMEFCTTPVPLTASLWGHVLERISWDEVCTPTETDRPTCSKSSKGTGCDNSRYWQVQGGLFGERCICSWDVAHGKTVQRRWIRNEQVSVNRQQKVEYICSGLTWFLFRLTWMS